MLRIECGVSSNVESHTGKDEEESVRNKGSGRRGKGERLAESASKDGLRGVVSDSQAGGHTHNVLGTSSPERFTHRAVNEFVEVTIVHLCIRTEMKRQRIGWVSKRCWDSSVMHYSRTDLLCRMLNKVGEEIGHHISSKGRRNSGE